MPTYQYHCRNCGHEIEELQSFSEPPLLHCPNCHKDTLARVLGGGGGLIFKGSGFYGTDYKKKSGSSSEPSVKSDKKKEKEGEKKPESPTPPPAPSESKPSGESKTPPPKED